MLREEKITEKGIITIDKVEESIRYLKAFEPHNGEGYFLAFSGGKDSCVLKSLADKAGVKYDAHYHVTSVDPPELVRFIRKYHPDVIFDYPKDARWDEKKQEEVEYTVTMWNLIPQKAMPPTRLVRYCCEYLKEGGGAGRKCLTGVRKAESARRARGRALVNLGNNKATSKMLMNDNDESREIVENCYQRMKTLINPIIDWSDEDVWEYIKAENLPYCELYDKGFKRIGCIGCPMNTKAAQELERYPKYKQAYLRAFEKMLINNKAKGIINKCNWETAQDVMDWWLGLGNQTDEAQIQIFESEDEE